MLAQVPRALILGITGQDGSYLAELLLSKGYDVHGTIRRSSSFNTGRVDHLYQDPLEHPDTHFRLHFCDVTDASSIRSVLDEVSPDEVYNLAAQSHVRVSFDQPVYTADVVAMGSLRVIEAIRAHTRLGNKGLRFYQASSSEMFGSSSPPQGLSTPFQPRSPYACAKVFAFHQVVNYREAYGLYAVNGILFNHESPRRGETFVTRKITRAATRIQQGLQQRLHLGNLDAKRDWGHARDYVEAMWMMLQQADPKDYVVATGATRSVREFLELAFSRLNLEIDDCVEIDPRYFRPTEVDVLCGDPSSANQIGWHPETSFEQLVDEMITGDLHLARSEKLLRDAGE
jgi:GDPmannose 4,6-dehydratase